MNAKLNLVEILKNVPKGTKLYSTIFGEVSFDHIDKDEFYPIKVKTISGAESLVTKEGLFAFGYYGDCTLFPSYENRDWSTFKVENKNDDSLTEESHYNHCGDVCTDNRFEIIEKAKRHLLENTNIETSKDEMRCLDNFLFRCWQMGWLKQFDVD